jgi:transposase-like protein
MPAPNVDNEYRALVCDHRFKSPGDALWAFQLVIWRSGQPSCPYCRSLTIIQRRDRRSAWGDFVCQDCLRRFAVLTGTIFERSRLPAHLLLQAVELVIGGIGTNALARILVIDLQTAGRLRQRIRAAMNDEGQVEIKPGIFMGRKE